ncbi:hypothetical protein FHR70_001962 [Microvirga lupini]|uniref:CoxF protein n=2 Tax=Microvirga lupini TaxID=420324 RepID=A0A7W4YXD6_9HYPH|nr:hypothetical protein [Microvirga lupini]
MMADPTPPVRLTPEEQKRRRQRSLALALALGVFCILLFAVTLAKLGPGVLQRPM